MENTLNNILEDLVMSTITSFSINGCKIYPLNENVLTLRSNGVKGYFNIMKGDELVYLISLRDVKDYTIEFRNNNISVVTFSGFRIVFKDETNKVIKRLTKLLKYE